MAEDRFVPGFYSCKVLPGELADPAPDVIPFVPPVQVRRLESLDEFNRRRTEEHESLNKPSPNGIACPECGSELSDANDGLMLTSDPPQVRVICPCCHWAGNRVI